jgi:hypothetical protein
LGSERFAHAKEMLTFVSDETLASGGFFRDSLMPIAASMVDRDIFVMARRSSSSPGMVIWFAGTEVDRFPDFDEYFLAMIDYNRLEIQHLLSSNN